MERSKTRRYLIGATTFATALGIGFVVQYGDAVASRLGADSPVSGPETRAEANVSQLIPVSAAVGTPQILPTPTLHVRAADMMPLNSVPADISVPVIAIPAATDPAPIAEVVAPVLDEESAEVAVLEIETPVVDEPIASTPLEVIEEIAPIDCDIKANTSAMPLATVEISVDAPCHTNQTFTVHHQSLSFDLMTDDQGLANANVPALNENALFIVSFEDGQSAMTQIQVSDMNDYDRAVLQWQGDEGVQLHALEFGAEYGSDGHIWNGAPGKLLSAEDDATGLISRLGENNLWAEVYTFPTGHSSSAGDIELSVEAEVTLANCGREVRAQTIQIGPNRSTNSADLSMMMPACDAIGEYLVLKNMFEDLTLAAR